MSAFTVQMIDLATKEKFDADVHAGLHVVRTRNGRYAFRCPAPTARGNLCYKFVSQAAAEAYCKEFNILLIDREDTSVDKSTTGPAPVEVSA